jgi:hypothetical protein
MENFYLPISIAIGLVAFGFAARCYLMPWARRRSLKDALTPLLFFHSLRYVGLAFLLPGVTAAELGFRFANPVPMAIFWPPSSP